MSTYTKHNQFCGISLLLCILATSVPSFTILLISQYTTLNERTKS